MNDTNDEANRLDQISNEHQHHVHMASCREFHSKTTSITFEYIQQELNNHLANNDREL